MRTRCFAPWASLVTALVFAVPAPARAAEGTAESVLTGKELRRSAEIYVLRAEDDVKKAADAAEARLKEYRYAVAREKAEKLVAAAKKNMATDLTKQRSALRQQMAQTLPQLRAQIQNLTQQRAALRQQLNDLRYANGGAGIAAYNQVADVYNALNNQIQNLVEQNNQLVDTDSEAAEQIDQLRSDTDPSKAAMQAPASPVDCREAYSEALKAWRTAADEVKAKYAALAEDDEVKAALEALNKRSPKIHYALGPSKKFSDSVKALEQAEAMGTSDPGAGAQPKPLSKRKARAGRRK